MSSLTIAADFLDPPEDHWEPLPHQIPPGGSWFAWMLMAGRGSGKTAAAARYMHEHIMGPPCIPHVPGGHWASIIAPTLGDAVTACVNGPSGLRVHCEDIKLRSTAGGTIVRYPNGAEVKLFGAHGPEDVERLRAGGNRCFVWAEELAAWRYIEECWQHMRYGLRLGPWPHVVISTTPKPRKLIKELFKRDDCVITTASTKDNPHLHKDVRKALYEDYEGTRMGRQELHAELLEDVENALWTYENIEKFRIPIAWCPEEFDRVVVGVDPAVSSVNDEHGIIVCGMLGPFAYDRAEPRNTDMSHAFVLDDQTMMGKPEDWARVVRNAFNDWQANLIVAEINNGYELVLRNIHALDDTLPVKDEWASRGKAKRAEPVANFYQQGRIHHVGAFEELEDQMTSFDPFEPDDTWSPDRMDAMVWGMTNLMVRKNTMRSSNYEDMRQRGRR